MAPFIATLAGCLLLQISPPPSPARKQVPRPLDLTRVLERAVQDNGGSGGGTLRIESGDGVVRWEGAAGSATRGGIPMAPDMSYEIASTSKTFTATLVLLLAEDGQLDLDDRIVDQLDPRLLRGLLVIEGRDLTGRITIRQLLNHTSGLPDFWLDPPYVRGEANAFVVAFDDDPERLWEPRQILPYAAQLTPAGRPGETYHYSDTGYLLLGLLIEQVTRRPLHQAYRELLFEPLGLEDTHMPYRERAPGGAVDSHRYEGRWDLHGRRHQSADWGGGGLISTSHDLSLFVRALGPGRVFRHRATLDEMLQLVPTGEADVSYGLGVFHLQLDDGLGELWGHDGYGNAFMYYWPQRDLAIVGTLNQRDNDWWPLCEAVVEQVTAR
jgi:D-alanyl-D-alanine carboxypeptidase